MPRLRHATCVGLTCRCEYGHFHAQATVHVLDQLAERCASRDDSPAHQKTGRRGEEDTYFYLRRLAM